VRGRRGDPADPTILLISGMGGSMDWWEDEFCQRLAAGGRFVIMWNRTLAWRHARYHGERVKTNFTQANAYLTAMRATEDLAWLNEVSSVPLQQAIRHQQAAYANFFATRARYPRFKSRTGRQSAEYTRPGFRYRDGQLFLAKMDTPLVFVWSWPDIDPAGIDPSTVTVSRDPCGRWYVSFAVEVADPEQLPAAGRTAGVDLGIKDFAVTSDGEKILTRTAWLAGNGTWPVTSAGWPAASAGRRTGLRPGRRSPAPTAKSAPAVPTSCTAPGQSVSYPAGRRGIRART
jgi:hypothetical protein